MLIAVGGHSRGIGKTSAAAGLIRTLPEFRWTAIKITQHGHGERNCTLTEEHDALGAGDSSRYLAAGAARSFWLRAPEGRLGDALPALREVLAASAHAILESNRILEFLTPDLYLVVLDFSVPDFKASARLHLGRAGAFVLIDRGCARPAWAELVPLEAVPVFRAAPPGHTCPPLIDFVRGRLPREPQP
ncbi:MAG: hypothetical protein ABSE56_00040 [Bryobacteraceae bacterium]